MFDANAQALATAQVRMVDATRRDSTLANVMPRFWRTVAGTSIRLLIGVPAAAVAGPTLKYTAQAGDTVRGLAAEHLPDGEPVPPAP